MIRRFVVLAFALLAITPVRAELVSFGDAVPGHAGKTYLDLVRLFVPDIVLEGSLARGETIIPLRHVAEGNDGRPPAAIALRWLEATPFRGQGRDGTLILVELGASDDRLEETAILAFFDEALHLVDAVDVGMGPSVGMDAPFRVAPGEDAVTIHSTFGNSAFAASIHAPVFLSGGRFQQFDAWTISRASECGWDQYQEIAFASQPDEGEGFWPVTVTVTDTVENDLTVSCPDPLPQPGTESASVTYRWDKRKAAYGPESDALDQFIKSRPDLY